MNGELAEFFAMGGHGLYVWLSYGVSFCVILGLVVQQRRAWHTFLRQARARSKRNQEMQAVENHASET